MKFENMATLRTALEQMETQLLDDMLLKELRMESPDGDLIRLIGSVLKEKDKNTAPGIDANIQQAWERYQRKAKVVHKRRKSLNNMLVKAAAILLALVALLAFLPQKADAMSFFERFISWTEDVFSLLNPAEAWEKKEAYVFQTDNPGLQEVYEKVVELGVTVPVVPTWIPDGYELVECKVTEMPSSDYLSARFACGDKELVYQLEIYSDNVTYEFYKGGTKVCVKEKDGIKHTIIQNGDVMVAVWTRENIQCSICVDCTEDTMMRILDSIYTMEVN